VLGIADDCDKLHRAQAWLSRERGPANRARTKVLQGLRESRNRLEGRGHTLITGRGPARAAAAATSTMQVRG